MIEHTCKNLMSNVTSWDEELFASGLEDVKCQIKVAQRLALRIIISGMTSLFIIKYTDNIEISSNYYSLFHNN